MRRWRLRSLRARALSHMSAPFPAIRGASRRNAGAGSLKAANYVFGRPEDGTVIGTVCPLDGHLPIDRPRDVRHPAIQLIGSITRDTSLCVAGRPLGQDLNDVMTSNSPWAARAPTRIPISSPSSKELVRRSNASASGFPVQQHRARHAAWRSAGLCGCRGARSSRSIRTGFGQEHQSAIQPHL